MQGARLCACVCKVCRRRLSITRSFVRRIVYKKRGGRLFPKGSLGSGAASLLRKKTWFSLRSSVVFSLFLVSTSFLFDIYFVQFSFSLTPRDTERGCTRQQGERFFDPLGRGKHATRRLFRFERLLCTRCIHERRCIYAHPVSLSFIISPLRYTCSLDVVNTRGRGTLTWSTITSR